MVSLNNPVYNSTPEVGLFMIYQMQSRFTDALVAGKQCALTDDVYAGQKIAECEKVFEAFGSHLACLQ